MNRGYMIAIIICKNDSTADGLKYHDIANTETKIVQFLKFAATKPGARYVNFYYKTTHKSEKGRNFAFRRYIN